VLFRSVRVSLMTSAGQDLTAEIPDHDFDAAPVTPGQAIHAAWDPARASPLE
jgi:hypothetical protein